mgnify:CR=1 FL=1
MAGHSHWAGIKHKKGKADKKRSNMFSKLSREIIVAAKLGDKDPDMNARLRSAIQAARSANMPKENIERAINKSELNNKPIKKHPEILISNVPMGKLEPCILLKFIYNIYLIIDPINPPIPTNNNCLNLN